MKVILASGSPRRQELLEQVGLSFTVIPSEVDERVDGPIAADALVRHLALSKAREIAARHPEALVVGADTVVVLEGDVLGKPLDRADAIGMLERLSGRQHQVMTGVALVGADRSIVEHEVTTVRFRPLHRAEIERYVDTGEPMDKAGAYGIQGRAAILVEGIEGDYFNVVGLPLSRIARMFSSFGITLL